MDRELSKKERKIRKEGIRAMYSLLGSLGHFLMGLLFVAMSIILMVKGRNVESLLFIVIWLQIQNLRDNK